MGYIFILSVAIIFIGLPVLGILIADKKTKAHCEQWVREMKLLLDTDYLIALHELDREFPGIKEE